MGYLLGPAPEDDGCRSRVKAAGEEVPAFVSELPLLEFLAVSDHVRGDTVDRRLNLASGSLVDADDNSSSMFSDNKNKNRMKIFKNIN